MKKFSIVAIISILLVCIISTPTWTKAEECPSVDTYITNYFGSAYTNVNNIVTFNIKKEYWDYVKVYVNDTADSDDEAHTGLVTPDENGNISLDLMADQNAGLPNTRIAFYFTPSSSITTATNCSSVKRTYTFETSVDVGEPEDDEDIIELKREAGLLPGTGASLEDLKDDSFIKVTDITKSNSLSCNYGKTDGKTVKKYTYTSSKSSSDTCTTTCREDVVVTLDPPVITESGMCFSYVVDIKSKVACSSKFTGKEPKKYKGCIANAICSGGTDKGGPNEEFDSCIESCDNGEYTQSCIDKCYTKVYEKNSKDTKKVKTKNNTKHESTEYLERLKSTNTFTEPQKLSSSLRKVNVGTVRENKKNITNKKITCYTDSYLASTGWMNDAQLTELAQEVYNSKQYLPGGYYSLNSGYEWTPSKRYYKYDTANGTYTLEKKGGCLSRISPHYFSSVAKTKLTIKELNGQFYYTGSRIHRYEPTGTLVKDKYIYAGGLVRYQISYDGGNSFIYSHCGESCQVSSSCANLIRAGNNKYPGNKWAIVTNTQAKQIYKAELKSYAKAKNACVNSTQSCYSTADSSYKIMVNETSKNTGKNLDNSYESNQKVDQAKSGNNKSIISGQDTSMIINTNGKCITGECANNQLYCNSLNKDSSEYKAYCDDKNSCKLSGIPACKNGDQCYDYHTTLSFPKNYINVKTGQTTTQVKKENLPFYVAIGNAYCTNLSAKEVNVDWYNYKIDDTNTVAKPSKINKYNITGTIKNYGYSKWNFDFSCFYAIKNPTSGDCVGDDCDNKVCIGEDCDDDNTCKGDNCDGDNTCKGDNCDDDATPPNNILSNVKVRSVNLSNLFPNRNPRFNWSVNAKNVNNRNYKVDPETLIKAIEATGDSIYDENNEDKYLDYEIDLTKDAIKTIREYNKGKTYNNSDNGTGVDRLIGQGTWGVTVYQSKLLDSLGGSVVTKRGLLGCNNQTGKETCNVEGGN